ncbi:unnamed protein product, partial [Arctogadus glacialis]
MGDEGCFKSVLPPQVLGDSSLALPAEHSILSPARFHSVDRSVRVQQQVQLTLARKGKKSASNGSEMGDEGCFKSVLPPQVLGDSSLALPAEHSILSPARFHSVDRSVRVQQQVQLTLARKGKKSASN